MFHIKVFFLLPLNPFFFKLPLIFAFLTEQMSSSVLIIFIILSLILFPLPLKLPFLIIPKSYSLTLLILVQLLNQNQTNLLPKFKFPILID